MLQHYMFDILNYQGFLNIVTIRESDLFDIENVKIEKTLFFDRLDFGNDKNRFLSITSFRKDFFLNLNFCIIS